VMQKFYILMMFVRKVMFEFNFIICSVANTCITLSSAAVQQPCSHMILENSVYIDAHHSGGKTRAGELERDRDGRTQKERKVSECNIDCPSAIINQHRRRRQSYLFFCLC
jgi:hypothetical protein